MILKIITDEIAAFLILTFVLASAWLKFHENGVIVFIITGVFFLIVYVFLFVSFKIFAPSILMKDGRYEDCASLCEGFLNKRYSIFRIAKLPRLTSFFKIYASHGCIKFDKITKAKEILELVEEGTVLDSQIIQYRIVSAYININDYQFEKALEKLTSINKGVLSDKLVPDMFYLVSLCYLELKRDLERALNYAQMAFSIKNFNEDYKLNYAIALLETRNDVKQAETLLKEINQNIDQLSSYGKQRLRALLSGYY